MITLFWVMALFATNALYSLLGFAIGYKTAWKEFKEQNNDK